MGVQSPLFHIEIKNSFIHVSDQIEEDVPYRSRALSEYSGICRVKELELLESSPVPSTACMKEAGLEKSVPFYTQGMLFEEEEARTTVLMRDIPSSYSSSTLIEHFDASGFWGTYDFVYLPIDFRTNMSLGYAFVNFVSSKHAQEFMMYFDGFSNWHSSISDECKVFWADPNQGLEEHLERYRNSPVMHESVPDEFKPRLYEGGVRVSFPEPTKRIKAPRVRPPKQRLLK